MLDQVTLYLTDPKKGLVAAPRDGQLAMAKRVTQTIEEKGVTFIEAPVGTGKSYAYLLPAVFSGERTVIATAKKSLQDQLATQDLPAIRKATGKQFTFTVLKGAGNYFCELRAQSLKDTAARRKIDDWQAYMGDIASGGDVISFPGGKPDFWEKVNAKDCHKKKCPMHTRCGYYNTLQAAAEANLVITNQHVLAHSLLRKSAVFGEYTAVVLDEAHQFPEALRGAQSKELSLQTLRYAHRLYAAHTSGVPVAALVKAWNDILTALGRKEGRFEPATIEDEVTQLQILLGQMVADYKASIIRSKSEGELPPLMALQHNETLNQLQDIDLALVPLVEQHTSRVFSLEKDGEHHGEYRLVIQPTDPGRAVQGGYGEKRAVIVTSGTLSYGGSFTHIARECGLPAPAAEDSTSTSLRCATPFNYAQQAVLYTPKHLPAPASGQGPRRDAWVSAISEEIKRLVEVSGGNTLVLFSSMSDLNAIHRGLVDAGLKNPIIAQQPRKANYAEEQYRATKNAVLLGSKSFFEGLNIVGDKLWSVIIPKLPFPVPTDPVIQARTDRAKERYAAGGLNETAASIRAFHEVSIPLMLFDVQQGGGRLIRSVTDRGVLSILDPRVWTGSSSSLPTDEQAGYKGYGLQVVEALGYPRRTSQFEKVKNYFLHLRK